jgi:peptidoglycan/xylan/chitin deacetylase (PgdA/CDA1 family)
MKIFARLALIVLITGLFSQVSMAKNVASHVPSGLKDAKKQNLFVESSTTPDANRAAPTLQARDLVAPSIETNAAEATTLSESTSLGPNLIQNPSFESADANGNPIGWLRGGYGTNTRTLSFPATPAEDGTKAASASISNYTSGDAKWYFAYVPVAAGHTYQFSDWSFATAASEIDVQLKMSDGTFKYIVLLKPGASSSYQKNIAQFTVPTGTTALTIFHVIHTTGTLTVDNYALNEVRDSGNPNLVPNGDFETLGTSGVPSGWKKGGYGTNTRTYTYPALGVNNSRGARVTISSYTSGDALWYFNPLALSNGVYSYSEAYQASVPTVLEIQYHYTDGSYGYRDLAYLPASKTFSGETIGFVVPRGVQDVTIFHLLNQVGTLTVDNVSVQKNTDTNGIFESGAVTLTFDNGWLSQYQNAIPAMDTYGFKGTFYIITHELADYGYPGFVSKSQIQSMYADGQEIGSHTQTHPYLTGLSAADEQQEISASRSDLLALHVGPINSFAYPYGAYDSSTVQMVEAAGYKNARTTILGYATPLSDHFQMPRYVILNTTTPEEIEVWIDEAIADKAWIILEFHEVAGNGDTYDISPADFNTVMAYLDSKHVPVVTMDTGMQSVH